MSRVFKWGGIALAAVVAVALVGVAYVYIASELIIDRHYPLPTSGIRAATDPAAIARGGRLAFVYGCADCHAHNLQGAFIADFGMRSRNLTMLATQFSDADFDRVIRHGLRPDGTSVAETMPSDAFQYMSDADVSDIIAYIRSRPHAGEPISTPSYDWSTRLKFLSGAGKTDAMWFPLQKPALDLGARYALGRQIAMVACGECHTTSLVGDLPPQPHHPPDLSIVAAYERADFIRFMHTGKAAGNRELPLMSAVARVRISHLNDAELNALYDYLAERGRKLTASGG
jgi:mono/diheme cytochrome c family protein